MVQVLGGHGEAHLHCPRNGEAQQFQFPQRQALHPRASPQTLVQAAWEHWPYKKIGQAAASQAVPAGRQRTEGAPRATARLRPLSPPGAARPNTCGLGHAARVQRASKCVWGRAHRPGAEDSDMLAMVEEARIPPSARAPQGDTNVAGSISSSTAPSPGTLCTVRCASPARLPSPVHRACARHGRRPPPGHVLTVAAAKTMTWAAFRDVCTGAGDGVRACGGFILEVLRTRGNSSPATAPGTRRAPVGGRCGTR